MEAPTSGIAAQQDGVRRYLSLREFFCDETLDREGEMAALRFPLLAFAQFTFAISFALSAAR
jgi:hypothetical protein